MPRTRAIIVISAVAAAAWLLPAAVRAVLIWFGPPPADGPGPLAPLLVLLPETVPVWAWHSVAPWPVVLPLLSALMIAVTVGVTALIVRRRMPALAWQVAIAVWAVVAGAGIVVFGVHAVGSLVDDLPFLRLATVADRGIAAFGQGLLWGALWGWIPGVVAGRLLDATTTSTAPVPVRRRAVLGGALAVLTAAALVAATPAATEANYAATGQHTTNGVQPAPPQPTAAPTPPPLVAPGAGAPDPSWCTTAQLRFSDGGSDAATGHRAGAIRVQNIGGESCVLTGYPDLAFAGTDGNAVAVTVTPGGGFMTDDAGPVVLELAPGSTAVAHAAWDATDGRTTLDAIYIAPYAGAERTVVTVANPWDLTDATVLAVTAWQAAD